MTIAEEYRAAAAREQEIRNLPLICDVQSVGEFTLRQITLADYLAFRMIGSPFFSGGEVKMSDVFAFVWRLSPGYPAPREMRKLKRRFRSFQIPRPPIFKHPLSMLRYGSRSTKAIAKLSALIDAIREFVSESVQDFPSGNGIASKSYYSEVLSICAMLGREYGWTQHYVLSLPIKCVLQYLKEIQQFHGGDKAILFNPSDRIISRWLGNQ